MTTETCNRHRGLSHTADDAATAHGPSISTTAYDPVRVATSGAGARTSDTIVDEPTHRQMIARLGGDGTGVLDRTASHRNSNTMDAPTTWPVP